MSAPRRVNVLPVPNAGTGPTHPSVLSEELSTAPQLPPTENATQESDIDGQRSGESKPEEIRIPTSNSSDEPASNSKKHYRKPRDAKGLAAQASFVATQVLNGEIDLDVARIYATLARTAAQGLGIEMQRGRMEHKKPDLDLEQGWEL